MSGNPQTAQDVDIVLKSCAVGDTANKKHNVNNKLYEWLHQIYRLDEPNSYRMNQTVMNHVNRKHLAALLQAQAPSRQRFDSLLNDETFRDGLDKYITRQESNPKNFTIITKIFARILLSSMHLHNTCDFTRIANSTAVAFDQYCQKYGVS